MGFHASAEPLASVASAKRRGRTASAMIVCSTPSALSYALRVSRRSRWRDGLRRLIGPARRRCLRDRRGHCRYRRAGPLHDLYAGVGDGPQHRVEGSDAPTVAARAALQTADPRPPACGRNSANSSLASRSGYPPSLPTRPASSPAAPAATSTTQPGERCSTRSGPGKPGPGAGQPDARPSRCTHGRRPLNSKHSA
jgi:hypothetical protein